MTAILASALVIVAVAAFLAWAATYRAAQQRDQQTVHGQLTAIRAALRDAGITVHAPDEKPLLIEQAGRHAKGRVE